MKIKILEIVLGMNIVPHVVSGKSKKVAFRFAKVAFLRQSNGDKTMQFKQSF